MQMGPAMKHLALALALELAQVLDLELDLHLDLELVKPKVALEGEKPRDFRPLKIF